MDSVGNIGTSFVIISKSLPEESPPGIPGYNTMLLFGIVIITSGLFIRKRLKN